jgi:N-acetylglutamate synthase/N-acetylornithine aminotransferase
VGMRITIKNMTYADDVKSFGYHSGFYTKGQIVDGAIVRAKGFASIFKTSQSGGHLVSSDVKALMHEQTNGAVVENSGGSFDITGNTNEL